MAATLPVKSFAKEHRFCSGELEPPAALILLLPPDSGESRSLSQTDLSRVDGCAARLVVELA